MLFQGKHNMSLAGRGREVLNLPDLVGKKKPCKADFRNKKGDSFLNENGRYGRPIEITHMMQW